MAAGGNKNKTKLSPQLGLAKLELGLSLAKMLNLAKLLKVVNVVNCKDKTGQFGHAAKVLKAAK